MHTYNETQIENIRRAGEIVSSALLAVFKAIKPGVSTLELNRIAEDLILKSNAEPAFKDHRSFDFATCMSVNEEIVHGKPRADKILQEGDIISVDIGARYNGFCADAARTFGVGKISAEAQDLLQHTKQCFIEATKSLKAGNRVGEIGRHIEYYIKHNTTYGILTNYFGHGIGRNVHEDPLIPNFVPKIAQLEAIIRKKLPENTAICIEPMICAGDNAVKTKSDGWTVVMADGKLSAHHENTLIIRKNGVEVVTDSHI